MFTNEVFTAEHKSKVKIGNQMAKIENSGIGTINDVILIIILKNY